MALSEIPLADKESGEQLMFVSMELAELVRALDSVEVQKKDANYEWNAQIKAYKKRILKLAYEMNVPK